MKISELIEELEDAKRENGDVEVKVSDQGTGNSATIDSYSLIVYQDTLFIEGYF